MAAPAWCGGVEACSCFLCSAPAVFRPIVAAGGLQFIKADLQRVGGDNDRAATHAGVDPVDFASYRAARIDVFFRLVQLDHQHFLPIHFIHAKPRNIRPRNKAGRKGAGVVVKPLGME